MQMSDFIGFMLEELHKETSEYLRLRGEMEQIQAGRELACKRISLLRKAIEAEEESSGESSSVFVQTGDFLCR